MAPLFADEDLELLRLLADQAAVILESRALIDEAARVQAREETARLKDEFLSSAAHDLKTPLTTLLAQAELLERRARRQPAGSPDLAGLERMVAETRRLRALVLELLDASRVESGRLSLVREAVDLVAAAREACARQSSEQHACTVESDVPLVGRFDPALIAQLLDNLVDNAVKYSPGGGPARVELSRDGDEARIAVSDRGIGIAPADLPQIFERFHRGAGTEERRVPGMGLGLYICRGIVEQHGGRIWATSEQGKGSTFHVALPLGDAAGMEASVQPPAVDAVGVPASGG